MQVKDIMAKNVMTVTVDTEVKKVVEILTEQRIHGVPVIDEDKKVIGIVTETNFFTRADSDKYMSKFVEAIKEKKLPDPKILKNENEISSQSKVESIMTKNCVTVRPEMDLSELFEVFRKKGYHTIPVADENGVLEGVVTVSDIIAISAKLD